MLKSVIYAPRSLPTVCIKYFLPYFIYFIYSRALRTFNLSLVSSTVFFFGHQIEDKLCQIHTNFAHYCGVKLTDNRQKIWWDKIYSFVLLIADTNINTNATETGLTSNKNRISQRKKAKSAFAEVTFVCSSKEKITT